MGHAAKVVAASVRRWLPEGNAIAKVRQPPGRHAERIVVDEVMSTGTVRLLRAKYDPRGEGAFDLEFWLEEREDVLPKWRVEAFVGMRAPRRLQEGDVFFVADGRKLDSRYEPVERDTARKEHLLMDWVSSRDLAREQMKQEFRVLAMRHSVHAPVPRLRELVRLSNSSLRDWED